MTVDRLQHFVNEDAAIRRRQRLQPVGGRGDKIFPPTYPGEGRNDPPPQHVFERRRLDGQEVWCVLVDSVQSQANRLEESLLGCIADGVIIPHLSVDFTGKVEGIGKITSLDAPHRVYDAIFRDSLYDEKPFMKSDLGLALAKCNHVDASALLVCSPTALLFGCWHSTGQGGGIGAKFARSLTSEIVAVNVPVEEVPGSREDTVRTAGRRTGIRIDPLGILRKVEVYKTDQDWNTSAEAAGKGAKKVRPSEINHGNIVSSVQPLGVTCDYAEQMFVLSFAALRRLHFGSETRSNAGRALLAALGLLALVEQDRKGYSLRSRCDLVCEGKTGLELVHPDGSTEEVGLGDARGLYRAAFQAAKEAGIEMKVEPVRLRPQDKLVKIIEDSQRFRLAGSGGEAETQ